MYSMMMTMLSRWTSVSQYQNVTRWWQLWPSLRHWICFILWPLYLNLWTLRSQCMSVMQLIVLHSTKFELRMPSRSEDMADIRSRR